ncbi:hypothetical protein FS749_011594 [Ceratobasidium sp. UAMH 11750]|nr:hypothetical protein FS749_011594 [Ceratobasidium sp. UAMH 11750]
MPMYIVRGCVGPSIKHLVKATAPDTTSQIERRDDGFWVSGHTLSEWIHNAIKTWQSQVPSGYWGTIQDLRRDEVYHLIANKTLTKDQFMDWLNQRAWNVAQAQLDADMAALSMGPAIDLKEQLEAMEMGDDRQGW